ncbi:MAG: hypothetical protein ACOYKA_01250 [Legionellaceae bacterium]
MKRSASTPEGLATEKTWATCALSIEKSIVAPSSATCAFFRVRPTTPGPSPLTVVRESTPAVVRESTSAAVRESTPVSCTTLVVYVPK